MQKSGDHTCAHWGLIHLYKLLPFQMNLSYRVQAGAYANRDLAEKNLKVVYKAGIKDAFIFKENVTEVNVSENESIMGQTILLPNQMEQFVQKVNPTAIELANFYVKLRK